MSTTTTKFLRKGATYPFQESDYISESEFRAMVSSPEPALAGSSNTSSQQGSLDECRRLAAENGRLRASLGQITFGERELAAKLSATFAGSSKGPSPFDRAREKDPLSPVEKTRAQRWAKVLSKKR